MSLYTRFHVWVDGKVAAGLITAARLNGEFDAIKAILNAGIEDTNIKTAAKVMCTDRAHTITGVHTYTTAPVLPAAGIADASLSANVPLLNAANSFSAKQTMAAGLDMDSQEIENLIIHKVASLPAWSSANIGQMYYCTGDGKFYGGGASAWKQMDYVGTYTGGAVRSYTAEGLVDDGNAFKLYFKTEGATPTVLLALKGEQFPVRFYKELAYHTHAFTGVAHTHVLTDAGHTHSVAVGSHVHGGSFGTSTHTHGVSASTGAQSANHTHAVSGTTGNGAPAITTGPTYHDHSFAATSAGVSADHTHSLSATTDTPSANGSVSAHDHGTLTSGSTVAPVTAANTTAAGTNASAGVNISATLASVQKLYGKALTITIDSTNITAAVLSALGWVALGDGLGTHALHATGTGEMDISALATFAPGYHTLTITEPEAGFGCSVMAHIETN